MNRRNFIKTATLLSSGLSFSGLSTFKKKKMTFKISLAEWSLHQSIKSNVIDHMDFYDITKNKFGLSAVEYVNTFFFDKAKDKIYLNKMKMRADDLGIESLLIMCDNEGSLGDPDPIARTKAVENHYKWIDAGKYLGCHSIRVNAQSEGEYDEQMKLAADGLSRLTEYGANNNINVIIENHGGLSSNGQWLAAVMEKVDHPRVGTLPDFGNFRIQGEEWYDRYKGVEELMPYAKAVSAKSHDFDSQGNEINTDYYKMMNIVLDAGYSGYVGIEYEGSKLDEMAGIQATKDLLEKVKDSL